LRASDTPTKFTGCSPEETGRCSAPERSHTHRPRRPLPKGQYHRRRFCVICLRNGMRRAPERIVDHRQRDSIFFVRAVDLSLDYGVDFMPHLVPSLSLVVHLSVAFNPVHVTGEC